MRSNYFYGAIPPALLTWPFYTHPTSLFQFHVKRLAAMNHSKHNKRERFLLLCMLETLFHQSFQKLLEVASSYAHKKKKNTVSQEYVSLNSRMCNCRCVLFFSIMSHFLWELANMSELQYNYLNIKRPNILNSVHDGQIKAVDVF